ncbi:MAG: hypothetical protein JO286_19695 [Solirubrobacterales bacterium]|nr:hypothetical protein [Solirubrobacterales bacterium]
MRNRSPRAGAINDRVRRRRLVLFALIIAALGVLALALTARGSTLKNQTHGHGIGITSNAPTPTLTSTRARAQPTQPPRTRPEALHRGAHVRTSMLPEHRAHAAARC